jgi:hypothetical protein
MNAMRIFSLLGAAFNAAFNVAFYAAFCALPLLAQTPAPAPAAGAASVAANPRRVVAPCELTSTALGLSGEESPSQGRGFSLHVVNESARTLALPRSPDFGWRVETREKSGWKLKAEGGPVRRVNATDVHLVVSSVSDRRAIREPVPVGSQEASTDMVEIAPARAQDFRFFLPEADPALRPEARLTTLKLTVYWAAPAGLAQNNRAVPACALAAEWVVTMRP